MFVLLDEDIHNATQEILAQFHSGRSDERPELRGCVCDRAREGKVAIVVTGNKSSGTWDPPRIPNVCDHFHIGYRTLLQLIRDKGWTFGRGLFNCWSVEVGNSALRVVST